MRQISLMQLVQLDEMKRPQTEPCVFCVDYTKGCLSDRSCSECNPTKYEKFVHISTSPVLDFGNWINFSERKRIAKIADEIIKQNNIKNDTFGVVCVLAIMGALKKPNEDKESAKQETDK